MGIINRLIKTENRISKGQINNNRPKGGKICANRKILFKQFNYEFSYEKYESVAS